jgi:hypothetical protein
LIFVVAAIFLSLQKTEIRWMTQNAETPPMAYAEMRHTHAG